MFFQYSIQPIQQKCNAYIKPNTVNIKFNQLVKNREDAFRSYFIENGTYRRVQIYPNENNIPYNGFSYYKINYKGDIPESLSSAYKALEKMNDEKPRKKYRRERKRDSHKSERKSNSN